MNTFNRKRKGNNTAARSFCVWIIRKFKKDKKAAITKKKFHHILREFETNETVDFKDNLRMKNHRFYEVLILVQLFI